MLRSLPSTVLFACSLAFGCERSRPALPEALASVSDSAGVRVVQIASDIRDLPLAYSIDPTPLADLGGQHTPDAELQSTAYRRILRLPDGRFVVTDNDNLKFFDGRGRLLHVSGRRGSGPGEFRQVSGLCIAAGDSIVAVDSGQRASILDLNGTFVRSFVLNRSVLTNEACVGFPFWLSVTDRPDPDDRLLHTVTITRISPDGLRNEPLLSLTYSDPPMSTIGPGMMASSFFTTRFNVVPFGDRLLVGHGGMPELRIYDLGGRLAGAVRWKDTPVALPDDVAACMIRNGMVIPPGADPMLVEQFVADRLRDPRPERASSFGEIKVDGGGRIWVQDPFLLTAGPPAWTVLESDGQPVGRVTIPLPDGADPRSVEVLSVWETEIALQWKQADLGFSHVTIHALELADSGAVEVRRDTC